MKDMGEKGRSRNGTTAKKRLTMRSLEKAKYIKRTGTPGNYRYTYEESVSKIKWESHEKWEDFVRGNEASIKARTDEIKRKSEQIADPKNRAKYYKREMREALLSVTDIWNKLKDEASIGKSRGQSMELYKVKVLNPSNFLVPEKRKLIILSKARKLSFGTVPSPDEKEDK